MLQILNKVEGRTYSVGWLHQFQSYHLFQSYYYTLYLYVTFP